MKNDIIDGNRVASKRSINEDEIQQSTIPKKTFSKSRSESRYVNNKIVYEAEIDTASAK